MHCITVTVQNPLKTLNVLYESLFIYRDSCSAQTTMLGIPSGKLRGTQCAVQVRMCPCPLARSCLCPHLPQPTSSSRSLASELGLDLLALPSAPVLSCSCPGLGLLPGPRPGGMALSDCLSFSGRSEVGGGGPKTAAWARAWSGERKRGCPAESTAKGSCCAVAAVCVARTAAAVEVAKSATAAAGLALPGKGPGGTPRLAAAAERAETLRPCGDSRRGSSWPRDCVSTPALRAEGGWAKECVSTPALCAEGGWANESVSTPALRAEGGWAKECVSTAALLRGGPMVRADEPSPSSLSSLEMCERARVRSRPGEGGRDAAAAAAAAPWLP